MNIRQNGQSGFGAGAVLEFNVNLALGDKSVSPEELDELLAGETCRLEHARADAGTAGARRGCKTSVQLGAQWAGRSAKSGATRRIAL